MSSIEHLSRWGSLHYIAVKTESTHPETDTLRALSDLRAAAEEACELHAGALRTEPHRDRKLSAAEAVEMKAQQTITAGGPTGSFAQADYPVP